jgi:hypothetical protein
VALVLAEMPLPPERACDGVRRRACSRAVSASFTAPPLEQRHRALLRGIFALVGAVVGFIGLGLAVGALHSGGRWAVGCFWAALVVEDAAAVYAVWQLGLARSRRWDLRGCVALLVEFVAWPVLLMFVGWTAMGGYVLFTGQPLGLFGD